MDWKHFRRSRNVEDYRGWLLPQLDVVWLDEWAPATTTNPIAREAGYESIPMPPSRSTFAERFEGGAATPKAQQLVGGAEPWEMDWSHVPEARAPGAPAMPWQMDWSHVPEAPQMSADTSTQGAAEAAAARVRQRERPAEGRAEGGLTRTIEAIPPAVGAELERLGKASHDLLTGGIEPSPENLLPIAAATINPAMRAGGVVKEVVKEVAKRSLPRYMEAGPGMAATAEQMSKVPIAGAPIRKAAEKARTELDEAALETVAPGGKVPTQARAGEHIKAGVRQEQEALDELETLSPKLKQVLRSNEGNETAYLMTLAGTGKGGDVNALGRIRANVPHKDWEEVSRAILARLGRTNKGWAPNVMLQNYKDLSPGGKNILFGDSKAPSSLRGHLDSLLRDSEKIDSINIAKKSSGLGKLGLAVAPMMVEPTTLLVTVLGARRMAKAMSQPVTAAPIAQWSRAFTRFVEGNGTPATIASLRVATTNLHNAVGGDFTYDDFVNALKEKAK